MFRGLILAFISLVLLVGCQGKNPWSVSETNTPESGTPTSKGTGDSGGGNLYQGKPLESYLQKPQNLPAFQNHLKAIVEAAIPDIQFPMLFLLDAKPWYFVPGPLQNLPESKIGSVVSTDQGALQDLDQVWIDLDLFNKMSESDQAKLILHEVLMGFKLLKFEAPKNACFALRYKATSDFRAECQLKEAKRTGRPSDLTVVDYAQIRQMTDNLMTINLAQDLDQPLKWRTLFHNGDFHFPGKYYISLDDLKDSTHKTNLTNARQSNQIGYNPQFGYSIGDLQASLPSWKRGTEVPEGTVWKSNSSCQIEFSETGGMNLQVAGYSVFASPQESDTKNMRQFWIDGQSYWASELTGMYSIPALPTAPNRQRRERVVALFDNNSQLIAITVQEWYFNERASSTWTAYDDDVLRGHYYVCALKPEIQFKKNIGHYPQFW
jgi:hypothetical protein